MAEITAIQEPPRAPNPKWTEIPRLDPAFDKYFKDYQSKLGSYDGSKFKNLLNANGTFLFQNGEQKHVIWDYYNYDKNQLDQWAELQGDRAILGRVGIDLLEMAEEVKKFYPWKSKTSKIHGFVIVGKQWFGMNPGGPEGINVNFREILPLINAYKADDSEKVNAWKIHLAASLAHELTHVEHDLIGDDSLSYGTGPEEVGPHIPQFLYYPENNSLFNNQLKRALDDLKKERDEGKPKKQYGYDWAQYVALLVTADKLTEEDTKIKGALEQDPDPSKIEGLKKIVDLARSIPEEKRKEIAAQFMEMINARIIEKAKAIEDKLGITSKLV